MPRTNVTPIQLAAASGVDTAATTTIDATLVTNGVRVVGAGTKKGTLVLKVTNSAGAAKVLTLKGGAFPGVGPKDLAISVAASGERMIALSETARWEQADQSYWIDLASGFTGALQVLRVPR